MAADNEKNTLNNTVDTLFKGMDGFLSTRTVIGEAIHIDDIIILPLVDVSFGVGAGAFVSDSKNNGGGGMGGKMSANAVLVIKDGSARLISVKNQDSVTKIIDMIPDIINKLVPNKKDSQAEEGAEAAADGE